MEDNKYNVNKCEPNIIKDNLGELLKYAIASGSIDIDKIKSEYDMSKKQKYLAMHNYDIYQGKDGEWYTYLPDENKEGKRVKRHRKNKEDLENLVCDFYAKRDSKVATFKEAFEMFQEYSLSMKQIVDSTYIR